MTCVNCGIDSSSKYCPNCGQRAGVKRITLREVWYDFWSKVYGFDGLFTRTLRDLTVHPGRAARSYIVGNRVMHWGPVGYLFLMVTLLLLVMGLLGINVTEYMKASAGSLGVQQNAGSGQAKFTESLMELVSDNLRWFSFAMVPMQAWCARYLFFRKSSLNFVEHTVLPFYLQGHVYWITLLDVIIYKLTGIVAPQLITVVATVIYFGYAYADFIDYQSKFKVFLKGIASYFISQFLFFLVILIVVVMLIIIFPDIREMVRPSNNP